MDVNRLRAEGVYESRAPVEGLAADLDQIGLLAEEWHASRKRLALGATVAWVVGIIAFATGALWYVGIALIAAGGWALYRMKSFPKAVANHRERCAFGKSMAAMLASDADPKTLLAIRLAFDPKEETLSEGALLGRKNGQQRLYKVSWFSIEARLHDGTTLSQSIDDIVRHRSFTNARGKSKTKVRTQSLIALRLDYPAETYGDLTPFRERMQNEIQLPPGTVVRALEVTGRAVKVKALATASGDAAYLAQASAMLALGVYRMLNLSREVQSRKRAQEKPGGPQ